MNCEFDNAHSTWKTLFECSTLIISSLGEEYEGMIARKYDLAIGRVNVDRKEPQKILL